VVTTYYVAAEVLTGWTARGTTTRLMVVMEMTLLMEGLEVTFLLEERELTRQSITTISPEKCASVFSFKEHRIPAQLDSIL
jgi:hypothetical protein